MRAVSQQDGMFISSGTARPRGGSGLPHTGHGTGAQHDTLHACVIVMTES
jgi:hypothetical protein